jgi:hypothetical protein
LKIYANPSGKNLDIRPDLGIIVHIAQRRAAAQSYQGQSGIRIEPWSVFQRTKNRRGVSFPGILCVKEFRAS